MPEELKKPLVEKMTAGEMKVESRILSLKNLHDHFFKALWKLLMEFNGSSHRNGSYAIVFSGFRAGDGASTMSLNFANAFAENSSDPVILIDGNIKDPILHRQFNLDKKKGLADALLGEADLHDIINEITPKKFYFIAAGQRINSPISYFESPGFTTLLGQLKERFKLVICDSAPLLSSPETTVMANKLDGLIMILNAEMTRWEVAKSVKKDLESANVRILGAILNRKQFIIPQAIYNLL